MKHKKRIAMRQSSFRWPPIKAMGGHTGALYREIPILDAARRRGLVLNSRTLEREELTVPLSNLDCDPPGNVEKAERHKQLLLAGQAYFPPLVCINRMVIDGQHRFWAYQQLGYQEVKIYQNVPWVMPAAA